MSLSLYFIVVRWLGLLLWLHFLLGLFWALWNGRWLFFLYVWVWQILRDRWNRESFTNFLMEFATFSWSILYVEHWIPLPIEFESFYHGSCQHLVMDHTNVSLAETVKIWRIAETAILLWKSRVLLEKMTCTWGTSRIVLLLMDFENIAVVFSHYFGDLLIDLVAVCERSFLSI